MLKECNTVMIAGDIYSFLQKKNCGLCLYVVEDALEAG
jgi:hypothetical protein